MDVHGVLSCRSEEASQPEEGGELVAQVGKTTHCYVCRMFQMYLRYEPATAYSFFKNSAKYC